MTRFMPMLKLDKASEAAGGAGAPETPPKDPAKPPAEQPPAAKSPPTEGDGDQFDELGYPKVPAEKPPEEKGKDKAGDPPAKTPPEKAPDLKDSASGYGAEPPKVDPPAEKPPETPPAAPDDLDKALEGVPKEDAKVIKELAVESKLSPEVVKKMGDKVKEVFAQNQKNATDMQKQFEQQKLQTRATWHKELKDDPTFGGENFEANVAKVNKTLTEVLPSIKETLTKNKEMLPPNVMRDLAKLADHLHPKETLQQGDPPAPPPKEEKTDDALDFYT